MSQLATVRHDFLKTERRLHEIERAHGKASEEFQMAQKKLLRLWSMMRLMRTQDEFLGEILTTPQVAE